MKIILKIVRYTFKENMLQVSVKKNLTFLNLYNGYYYQVNENIHSVTHLIHLRIII